MTKNMKVSQILDDIADILELQGVDWKPRAYRNAARTVRSLDKDIETITTEGNLEELPNIGASIAKKIKEIVETGKLQYYEDLKDEFPDSLKNIMDVEGIGPKTTKKLYQELGIKTLDDLERAAKEHKIRELEGMGETSEQNILKHLDFARKKGKRQLLGYIWPICEELKQNLVALQYVSQAEIAGSVRRRKETIGDIDILVVTEEPAKVMDSFVQLENIEEVIAKGEAKTTVRLQEGMKVDVRVIQEKSFGSALLYFTGSKNFNVTMRQMAINQGYKLSEYGLFKKKTEEFVAGKTEQAVFKQLGLQYIPPELRENKGELEAASQGELPQLIEYDEIKGDLQMHSKWSDGAFSIEEMVHAAKELGHEYIAMTDHVGTLKIAGGMEPDQIQDYMKEIAKLNKTIDGITVLKGAEVNIQSNGELDMPNSILKQLDVVVASIHSGFRQAKEKMTNRILSAMDNEYVNIIAHPTGRKIQSREGYDLEWDKIFEKSKQTNTFLEINAHPQRLDLNDEHTRAALEQGCKLVINTDAHDKNDLTYMKFGIATARRGWAKKADIINTLPLSTLRKLLL